MIEIIMFDRPKYMDKEDRVWGMILLQRPALQAAKEELRVEKNLKLLMKPLKIMYIDIKEHPGAALLFSSRS